MGCFVYDGVDLASTFEVLEVEIPAIAPVTADLRQAAGLDGAAFAGSKLGPLEITVTARIATAIIDPRDIQRTWADAVAAIRKTEPKPLYLVEGRYRNAILVEDTPLEFATYSATGKLKFACPDPVSFGTSRSVTVPSGGSVTFEVGGTYPAAPYISASAVRDSSSQVWGLRLDSADFIHVATGSASARAVRIDCAKRTLTVASAAKLPTLDSDWLSLPPGSHTLQMDNGTGAATVTFAERWL